MKAKECKVCIDKYNNFSTFEKWNKGWCWLEGYHEKHLFKYGDTVKTEFGIIGTVLDGGYWPEHMYERRDKLGCGGAEFLIKWRDSDKEEWVAITRRGYEDSFLQPA